MSQDQKPSTEAVEQQPAAPEGAGPLQELPMFSIDTVRLLIVAEMQEFAQFLAAAKAKRLSLSPEYLVDTLAIRCTRLITGMDPIVTPNMEKIQPALEHGAKLIDELAKQQESRIIIN